MRQYCVGYLCVQIEQVFQHVTVIIHIVVYGYDDGFGEVSQSRYQFAVGAYVAVVVAYLEHGVLLGERKQTFGHFALCEL